MAEKVGANALRFANWEGEGEGKGGGRRKCPGHLRKELVGVIKGPEREDALATDTFEGIEDPNNDDEAAFPIFTMKESFSQSGYKKANQPTSPDRCQVLLILTFKLHFCIQHHGITIFLRTTRHLFCPTFFNLLG